MVDGCGCIRILLRYEKLRTCFFQIDFLQQKNEEALAELEHARNRAKSAKVQNLDSDEKNIQLARELKDADTKAYQIQHEKESAIRAADHEVVETKVGTGE